MKKIFKKPITPYIILFTVMLVIHLLFKVNWGDDAWFKSIADNGILDYIGNRYSTWSSRIIIESLMIFLLQLPSFIWAIMNSLIICLLVYSISYLFTNKKYNWLIILLVLLYPLNNMNSAGWYATTMNYLWPITIGLFSLIPIKNILNNKKEKKYMYPLYFISLIYACNQEQMCAIILCFCLIFIVYIYNKTKKIDKFVLLQFIFSIISIVFILTCPGNGARTIAETTTWYPAYESFGLFSKLFLGMFSTTVICIFNFNIPTLLLFILLPICIFKNKKNLILKLISLIPLIMIIIMNFGSLFISKVYPGLMNAIESIRIYASNIDEINICGSFLVALAVFVLLIFSIIVSLYYLFKEEKKYLVILIFLAGLASRIIIGFSPTIFASGLRTFIFLDFSIIIIIALLLIENNNKINKDLLYLILIFLSIAQIANTIQLST